jgi:hypothetical protein
MNHWIKSPIRTAIHVPQLEDVSGYCRTNSNVQFPSPHVAQTLETKPKLVQISSAWTFVTKNSIDFRGTLGSPGSRGQPSDVALHAGLRLSST